MKPVPSGGFAPGAALNPDSQILRFGGVSDAPAFSPAIGRRVAGGLVVALLGGSLFLSVYCFVHEASGMTMLAHLLMLGACVLAGVVFVHACLHFSVRTALALLALSFGVSWTFESLGQVVPFPWGATYTYHPALTPLLPGRVPVFICLSWFVLAYGPLVLLDRFEARWNGEPWSRHVAKALLCAVALMSGDFLLDPLCVAAGLWRWDGGGAFHDVPLTNFSGWIAVGFSIYLPLVTAGLDRPRPRSGPPSRLAVVLAAVGLLLQLFAIVVTIRYVGSVVPVAAAIAVKLPFTVHWIRGRRRRRATACARCESSSAEPLQRGSRNTECIETEGPR